MKMLCLFLFYSCFYKYFGIFVVYMKEKKENIIICYQGMRVYAIYYYNLLGT